MNKSTEAQPEIKQKLIRSGATPSLYAEGVSQLMLGFPMSRVYLNNFTQQRTSENGEMEEVHQIACEIIMPTPALIEFARAIINTVVQNSEELATDGKSWIEHVTKAMDNLVYTDPAGLLPPKSNKAE